MLRLFISVLIIIVIYATCWFLVSLITKRNDVADIAWGPGYILLCIYLFLTKERSVPLLVLYLLVTIWGLRLAIHIYLRNRGKTEDFRYKNWRESWRKWFYLRSYLQVYILQGIFLIIIISPVLIAGSSTTCSPGIYTWTGIIIWLIGFFFQAVGDYQLSRFTKTRKSKDEIMKSGLWKYSRHPNYFGEIVMWWGIFIITIPAEYGIFGIISPVTITWLLLFVSGIPMLEEKYSGNPAFEDYKKKTSILFPLPPKK